jgi:hypothetical protein
LDIAEVGVDAIRAKSRRMTARLLALVDAHAAEGFRRRRRARDPERRGERSRSACRMRLVAGRQGVSSSSTIGRASVSVSPHFYNTMDDRSYRCRDRVDRREARLRGRVCGRW